MLALIALVEERPALYNVAAEGYKYRNVRSRLLGEISRELAAVG